MYDIVHEDRSIQENQNKNFMSLLEKIRESIETVAYAEIDVWRSNSNKDRTGENIPYYWLHIVTSDNPELNITRTAIHSRKIPNRPGEAYSYDNKVVAIVPILGLVRILSAEEMQQRDIHVLDYKSSARGS